MGRAVRVGRVGHGEARPWALTALLAAHRTEGDGPEATAAADTLAAEYAGTDHALYGLAMQARLSAAAGNLAGAERALGALEAGWPDLLATASAAALVRRLEGAIMGGRTGGQGEPSGSLVRTWEAAAGAASFRLFEARPNPFTGRTAVPFEVAESARVRLAVYDVLGREVAVLAEGRYEAGRYEAALDGGALAAGLYVVSARVETASGARRSHSRRVTVLR